MTKSVEEYTGGFHTWKQNVKERWQAFKGTDAEGQTIPLQDRTKQALHEAKEKMVTHMNKGDDGDYSHIYRRKSRGELIKISAAVMGIEFCYAAETAFVSPTLLAIGVEHSHMTLAWCLSPFVGFFLTPILGSLSDRCNSRLGRRRPFILLLSIGILLGLIFVPNGKNIGISLGDYYPPLNLTVNTTPFNESTFIDDYPDDDIYIYNDTKTDDNTADYEAPHSHPWGIFFTVMGTVLLDFDCDACQSPSRAYLLDVTLAEDHALGLSMFTVMAGLGGSLGYVMGGINWDATFIGPLLGGHVKAVFTLITFIFIACVITTMYSFKEIPLDVLDAASTLKKPRPGEEGTSYESIRDEEDPEKKQEAASYGTMEKQEAAEKPAETTETSFAVPPMPDTVDSGDPGSPATLKEYLLSIIFMPKSLRLVCLTNFFCWSSLLCYSLYFTDFVGEAVFGGDPQAPDNAPSKILFEEGVRFGCFGMALYSLSCSIYSFCIDMLVRTFRARMVYVCGQLVYTIGMIALACLRNRAAVIVFSCCAGVMYSTLFTMPYLLVAQYHETGTFSQDQNQAGSQVRGLGTDVAIVSSMVFLAQLFLSAFMGSIIASTGSTLTVVIAAAIFSFLGACTATQIMYLDL